MTQSTIINETLADCTPRIPVSQRSGPRGEGAGRQGAAASGRAAGSIFPFESLIYTL